MSLYFIFIHTALCYGLCPFILPHRTPLTISCRAGPVVTNLLSFTFSGKVLIFTSFMKNTVLERFLGFFFPLLTHFLLASRVSDGKSAYKLIEDHLELMLHFSHCFQDLLFIFSSWKFDYNISWCGFLCVHISCSIAYSCLSSNLRSQSLFLCSFLSILLLPLRLPWC